MWLRSSRTIQIDDIPPTLRRAVEEHCAGQLMGDLGTATACCATRSVHVRRPGLNSRAFGFDEPEQQRVDILLPRYLVVARMEGERRTYVVSARLASMTLGPSLTTLGAVISDFGVAVTAQWSAHGTVSPVWIGLGDDADGYGFLTALRGAVAAARPA
ncbi:hypothetical protein SAMN05444365_10876 [Micromonospora pattaloongensis]|uniref:Uncharacterized protein n=2 Tax=Micromonospora pattaloongensis TaxID=405436 RepID=A0A1H3RIJ5_9ACTN|nr:hypothetical protein SAMN05444365_10876 [Micromonospora pattaloongensis]